MLKLTTDKHESSRGLSATAELLVLRGLRDGSKNSRILAGRVGSGRVTLFPGRVAKFGPACNCDQTVT